MILRLLLPATDRPGADTSWTWSLADSRGGTLREGTTPLADVPRAAMAFGYDRSRLQGSGEILLWAVFDLTPGAEPAALRRTRSGSRSASHPRTKNVALTPCRSRISRTRLTFLSTLEGCSPQLSGDTDE